MKNTICLLIALLLAPFVASAQPASNEFDTYHAFRDSLDAVVETGEVEAFWQGLKDAGQVPFAIGDSVAFLYRGDASSVAWNGDFNAWGNNVTVPGTGTRLGNSDLWIWETTFPSDARLDYKIVLNGTNWILDPNNPRQQWSGFGPNSELRMPDYVYPEETLPRADIARGTFADPVPISSTHLGYDVNYRVYTPAGYDTLSNLPTLYVTDGHEYADDRLGSMLIVLDNLIADGLIEPVIGIFVDPREPGNAGNNRRQRQYADDYASFAAFLAEELVPTIDAAYRTDPSPDERGIMGTSLGGLFAGYLGAARSDVFRCIAIHSPAFSYDTQRNQDHVYQLYNEADRLPLRIFMSTGVIHDTEDGARRMRDLFDAKGYPLQYLEVNEGHSWGNWRGLLDAPLMHCWGTDTTLGLDDETPASDGLTVNSYPNPSPGDATIVFDLPAPQRISLDVYNLLGRRVDTLLDETSLAAGVHAVTVAVSDWPSGLYIYRLQSNEQQATGQLLLIR